MTHAPHLTLLHGDIDAPPPSAAVQRLRDLMDEIRVAHTAARTLYWDERVALPPGSMDWRARQRAWASRHAHELRTSTTLDAAISTVEDEDAESVEAARMRHDFERARMLPVDVVERQAAATSRTRAAWMRARELDDFDVLAPELEGVLEHARSLSDAIGWKTERYDALLAEWEPGIDAAGLELTFTELVGGLRPIIDRQPEQDDSALSRPIDLQAKLDIERALLGGLGFDYSRGAVAGSPRAFCLRLGPDDVRIATRYHVEPGLQALTSSLHEAGHAIYLQAFGRLGVPSTLAEPASLGVDESQSRLFENQIGRSREFWEHAYPVLHAHAPEAWPAGGIDDFHAALCAVRRGFSRVDADELTYNLHVAVRFELERALINGDLEIHGLREAWNESMERVLGVRPPSDREGVLQDVHWSIGQWGYFPSYTLGNVFAAQLMRAAARAMPGLAARPDQSDLADLVGWLDQSIYRHGRGVDGAELVRRVDGPLDAGALVGYLERRYS